MRIRLISGAGGEADDHADRAKHGAFDAEHRGDLRARESKMPQRAEFAATGEHLCAHSRGDAEQPDQHRHQLEQIGHRERAIECGQRQPSQLPRRAQIVIGARRQGLANCSLNVLF